jgi:iron complex outermembrane receptor protein
MGWDVKGTQTMTASQRGQKAATFALRATLAAGVCAGALMAGQAMAADAAPGGAAGSGSEGTSVNELIVTAERHPGAAAAPTKASLDETQPESVVSHAFIEKFTPEGGNYTTVLQIAPSIGGISSDGGGISDTNKTTLRGFQDGQYNLTYDGIAFGDTNDPTHHPADYFPAADIGAAVVDRGPGAAGDLGQANYGGAIHLFSPTLSDVFNIDQKLSYGTWNTTESLTSIQTGEIAKTGGTKALFIFDYRGSDSELSGTSGRAYNTTLKIQQPVGPKGSITAFIATEYARFYQSDANLGETWAQVLAYGKNFSLSRNQSSGEFWDGYNHEKKNTDFEYVKFNYDFDHGLTLEDQGYTYFYSNKTISADDNSGLLGGANTSTTKDSAYPKTDIGGYNKGNRYRVYGDILRVNQDFGFGTLKVGGLFEGSDTDRHNILFDLTTGLPDYSSKYAKADPALPASDSNIKTLETSSWHQYQLFADFYWRPLDNLTISPGFKYVNFTRTVAGIENSVTGAETRAFLSGTNTYDKPLYFGTINYKITPDWSVYAQTATGFLIPSLTYLYSDNLSLQNLKPTQTRNYQGGTVFNHGPLTADADIYRIYVTDQEIANAACQCYVNGGNALYSGVEGEVAYLLPFGLTVFANGSINTAKNTTANSTEPNAPKWTDAFGLLYNHKGIEASLTWKQVGSQVVYTNPNATAETTPDGVVLAGGQEREIGAYSTLNGTVAYDFGHYKVKVGVFNIADKRSITSISGTGAASDFYTFEAGREILLTLEAKLR